MQKLLIKGKKEISGTIAISGSKNATLPILAASLLAENIKLSNVPLVKDIFTMLELLKFIGIKIKINKKNKTIKLKNKNKIKTLAPYKLVKTMRAGVLVLGPLLTKYNKAKVSLPGGCAIGTRPVDLHLFALKKLGAKIKIKDGYIIADAPRGLKGAKIKFPSISVGATENGILAAFGAKGKTVLSNCAIEPEILDLILFLKKLGSQINISGRKITVIGKSSTARNINHKVIFDRIEAGTYLVAGSLLSKKIVIKQINTSVLKNEISVLKKMGVKIIASKNSISIFKPKGLKKISLITKPYPGFPTDIQAQWMSLMCLAKGVSEIKENIYTDRFTHVAELNRFGADIKVEGNTAYINGVNSFTAAPVMSTDIRASASLILASLSSKGESSISRIYHIDRGYENIESKITELGGSISRKK